MTRRLAALALLVAACGGGGAPAEPGALLVDLAIGTEGSFPTFAAAGDDLYWLTDGGVLARRRAGAITELAAPAEGARLIAANSAGAFTVAAGALSFTDDEGRRELAAGAGRFAMRGDDLWIAIRVDGEGCLYQTDGTSWQQRCGVDVTGIAPLELGVLTTIDLGGTGAAQYQDDDTATVVDLPIPDVSTDVVPVAAGAVGYLVDVDGSIWRTDGSIAGTVELGAAGTPATLVATGAGVFAYDGTALWWSDGVAAPVRLNDVDWMIGGHAVLGDAVVVNAGTAVYVTAGAAPVELATVPTCCIAQIVATGAAAYFVDAPAELEPGYLWRTDGTVEGTERVSEALPGVDDTMLGTPDALYLGLDDVDHGVEPWERREDTGELSLIADVETTPRSSEPATLVGSGDVVYFTTQSPLRSWRTDGTADGTEAMTDGTWVLIFPAEEGGAWTVDGARRVYHVRPGEQPEMIGESTSFEVAASREVVVYYDGNLRLFDVDGDAVALTDHPQPVAIAAAGDVGHACYSTGGLVSLPDPLRDAPPCRDLAAIDGAALVVDATTGHLWSSATEEVVVDEEVVSVATRGGLAFAVTTTPGGSNAVWRVTVDGAEKIAGGGAWEAVTPLGWVGERWLFDGDGEVWATGAASAEPLPATGGARTTCVVDVGGGAGWLWRDDGGRWITDGTPAGTRAAAALPGFDGQACAIAATGDRVVYRGVDDAAGAEPWTARIRDVMP